MRRIQLIIIATIVALVATMAAAGAAQPNFRTHLSGDQEMVPVDTNAQGQATLKVSNDGTSMDYRLIVANIEDVTMAHLHLAPGGQNGGIVVWLYPEEGQAPQLIPGRTDGTLATGTITDDDLVGALEGMTLDDLVAEIQAGNIYVNVHTVANPGGEIRGQLS